MKIPTLALAAMAAIATIPGGADFVARKEQTMGTQSARVQDGKAFHIFNPETMAKPTAGYSQVAEVGEGRLCTLLGRSPWTG